MSEKGSFIISPPSQHNSDLLSLVPAVLGSAPVIDKHSNDKEYEEIAIRVLIH